MTAARLRKPAVHRFVSRTAGAMVLGAVAGATPAGSSMLPEKPISRATTPFEWPFSIDEGKLSCIAMQGQRYVFFSEPLPPDAETDIGKIELQRMVVVSTNPMAYFATFEHRELYLPWDSLETLIKRLAPYERMGTALCDAPADPPEEN